MKIIPVEYSDSRKKEDIAKLLSECPHQTPNTIDAFEGKVMEFYQANNRAGGVGTLNEFHLSTNLSEFTILTDDGEMVVFLGSEGWKLK